MTDWLGHIWSKLMILAGAHQNLRGVTSVREHSLPQSYGARVGAPDILGARIVALNALAEAVCRKRHWSQSLRMIGSFASL
jgi:hypothetical protein